MHAYDDIIRFKLMSTNDDFNYRYKPYIELWCNVIKDAFKKKDITYLKSDTFQHHCDLLGLDKDKVLELAKNYYKLSI